MKRTLHKPTFHALLGILREEGYTLTTSRRGTRGSPADRFDTWVNRTTGMVCIMQVRGNACVKSTHFVAACDDLRLGRTSW